jgi:transcriptional regulator with XRE-family HTH domain
MANLDVTDAKLADQLQTSRQTINSRRKGRVTMTADDVAEVAAALGVDPALFFGQPSDAVLWLVEHRPDLLNGAAALEHKGCIVLLPAGRASTRRAIMPVPVGAGASTGVSAVAA